MKCRVAVYLFIFERQVSINQKKFDPFPVIRDRCAVACTDSFIIHVCCCWVDDLFVCVLWLDARIPI